MLQLWQNMEKKMKQTKAFYASFILNFLIFAGTIFASYSMFTGLRFMSDNEAFSAMGVEAFKFYTVDSNILAGLVALIIFIFQALVLCGKVKDLPHVLKLLNLASTTSVTLTMMITVFFLAPTSKVSFWYLFLNSNFFMHLLTPILCIASFILYEREDKIKFPETLFGVLPTILYAIYYIPNVFTHLDGGKPNPKYDWYGFFMFGVNSVWLVIPVIMFLTWCFSLILFACNKKRR